jgi:predicted SAM-dependent methyltransferase
MKLNIGCGSFLLDGFVNCDLYNPAAEIQCDAKSLPFDDNSIEEIYSYHLIEHFDFHDAFNVVGEWYRVLQDGGLLHIQTPDLLGSCKKFIEIQDDYDSVMKFYSHFFAYPWIPGQTHKFMYIESQLRYLFENCGFKDIKRIVADRYNSNEDVNLGMIGYK